MFYYKKYFWSTWNATMKLDIRLSLVFPVTIIKNKIVTWIQMGSNYCIFSGSVHRSNFCVWLGQPIDKSYYCNPGLINARLRRAISLVSCWLLVVLKFVSSSLLAAVMTTDDNNWRGPSKHGLTVACHVIVAARSVRCSFFYVSRWLVVWQPCPFTETVTETEAFHPVLVLS